MGTRRRVGFVTCKEHADLTADDRLVVTPLAERGIDIVPVIWSETPLRGSGVEALIVRSTWDYIDDVSAFNAWLGQVAASGIRVHNALAALHWNLDKRYLLELETRGVPIVPTAVLASPTVASLTAVLQTRGWHDVIVKPTVSCSAKGLRRLSRGAADDAAVEAIAAEGKDVLVQPFVRRVVEDGELSFVFFRGVFSHAVRKRPPPGDFRAQEHLGGITVLEPAPSAAHVTAARAALQAAGLAPAPLYARVDVLEEGEGIRLMELELVEPLLYLALAHGANERFADAIVSELGRPA